MSATAAAPDTLFGSVHLGYAVIETLRFDDWRRFGTDAIGMHVDDSLRDFLRFRLDDHECRFLLQRGPAEDVVALGWHVDDHASFDEIVARVRSRDVPATEGTPEESLLRGVERLVRFPGPKGIVQEVFTRPLLAPGPLDMATGTFVTGASGMGHVALTSTRPHQVRGYFATVFDARLSDFIEETINGARLKIRFLRVNERHHTLAIAATRDVPLDPIATRVQHLNVQVATLDDMVAAYRRVRENGFDIALSVGQHTNDKELSFYARTPSGFEWEVGWNPIVVDEATWEPTTHQGISIWGHTPVGQTVLDKLSMFRVAAGSARRREDTVPALSGQGIPD